MSIDRENIEMPLNERTRAGYETVENFIYLGSLAENNGGWWWWVRR